jgi:tetrahydromethanopterin S-methyltransferase subunit H
VDLSESNVEQKVLRIGDNRIGGIPGDRPTVLIGTLFYKGQKVFTDEEAGVFDQDRAEALIRQQEEFSDKTGNPHMIDLVLSNKDVAIKLIDFTASKTSAPIAVDAPSKDVRKFVIKHIMESGLHSTLLYNSFTSQTNVDEMILAKEAGFQAFIILAYNPQDLFTVKGRLAAIHEIMHRTKNLGIEALMVDTCVLDLPTLGPALESMKIVKTQLGLPTGCGAHNAVSLWKGLSSKMGSQAVKPCGASAIAVAVSYGADFVLYGPIEDASIAFPAAAMMDVALSQNCIEKGLRIERTHPRYRIG